MVTFVFYAHRRTQLIAFITMSVSASGAPVLKALQGVHQGPDVAVEYWDLTSRVEVESFLTEEYELFRFDWKQDDEETQKGPEWDFEDALAWEITPVQRWAKGESLTVEDVDSLSEWLGIGVGYNFDDVLAGFPNLEQ